MSTTSPKRELFEAYISCNEDMVRDEFKNREGNMSRFTDIPSVIMVKYKPDWGCEGGGL